MVAAGLIAGYGGGQISAGFARSGERGEAETFDDALGAVTHLIFVLPSLSQGPGLLQEGFERPDGDGTSPRFPALP